MHRTLFKCYAEKMTSNVELVAFEICYCLFISNIEVQMYNIYLLLQVQVLFCGPNIVKVNVVRAIAAKIYNSNLSRLILVVQNKMTNQALKALDLLSIKVEVFQVYFQIFFIGMLASFLWYSYSNKLLCIEYNSPSGSLSYFDQTYGK